MGGHGQHDGFNAANLTVVHLVQKARHLTCSWQHAQHLLHGTHLPEHFELIQQVLHGEAALHHPHVILRGLLLVDGLLGLLDQSHDIAHVQNSAGEPIRLELLEVCRGLASAEKSDRTACDLPNRERRTPTRVAVDLRQNDAVPDS